MRNLRRRIEVLERARSAARDDRQAIATRALNGLWQPQMEGLIGAFGAQREGRELSADESAAKQAYAEALTRECRLAGYASSEGFEDALDIREAMNRVVALRMSRSGVELALRALEAQEEGLVATQEESDALQRCNGERFQLGRLAGFRVPDAVDVPEDGPQ